jgi:hypothetical protein
MRNVVADDPDITWEDLQRIRGLMDEALPDALTEGYKDRIVMSWRARSMPGPIISSRSTGGTFRPSRLRDWDVEAIGPDELVSDLFGHSLRDLISEEKSLGSGASTSRIAPRASTR